MLHVNEGGLATICERLAHSPVVNICNISMVVLVHLLALFASAQAAHRKVNFFSKVYFLQGAGYLSIWPLYPFLQHL